MGDGLAYALEVATSDVADAIRSLLKSGFELDGDAGGRDESFGNVQLQLVRRTTRVVVSRDRGQWIAEIRPAWAKRPIPLHVLLTGRDGTPPADAHGLLPPQLPEGVSWAVELPALVRWAEDADHRKEVDAAEQRWRHFMKGLLSGEGL